VICIIALSAIFASRKSAAVGLSCDLCDLILLLLLNVPILLLATVATTVCCIGDIG